MPRKTFTTLRNHNHAAVLELVHAEPSHDNCDNDREGRLAEAVGGEAVRGGASFNRHSL